VREVFESSEDLELPTSQHYADRGEVYAFLGLISFAISDLNEAVTRDPLNQDYRYSRARIQANAGNFDSALADINSAIQIDSGIGEYFVDRGVINYALGKKAANYYPADPNISRLYLDRSTADFESAVSLGEFNIPPPDARTKSYFVINPNTYFEFNSNSW
jgi:tetratricopeptide (TPR) repeat protein